MGMFSNYDNITPNYIPNNIKCSFPVVKSYTKLDPVQASKPYEEYNTKGELVGYFWRYGETLNLEFNIEGEITVESDAIIFACSGDEPTLETKGKLNQRAYNIADLRSWTCVNIVDELHYVWEEDQEFTYDESSDTKIYISAKDFLQDKNIKIALYNFRHELIHEEVVDGTPKVIFSIDTELSKQLKRGLYYCSLTVFNSCVTLPIFNSTDCTLLVK